VGRLFYAQRAKRNTLGELEAVGLGDFRMEGAAVIAGKQGRSNGRDDGGFEVRASKVADGFEGIPIGFDDDFDFAFEAPKENSGTQVTMHAAKLGQDIL